MPWDDELRRLSLVVRATFGEDVWENALTRAMDAMRTSQRARATEPFDADEACYAALKRELRRLLHPH